MTITYRHRYGVHGFLRLLLLDADGGDDQDDEGDNGGGRGGANDGWHVSVFCKSGKHIKSCLVY